MAKVSDVFNIRYGNSLSLSALTHVEKPEGINFISRKMSNNGCTGRVLPPDGTDIGQPGEMTVALSGNGVLSSFVQPEQFVTGYHVAILSPKDQDMSLNVKVWYGMCIRHNRYRYSYGRQANRTLADLIVPDEIPAWVLKRNPYDIDSLSKAQLAGDYSLPDINQNWAEYRWDKMFDIKRGRYVPAQKKSTGMTPEVTSSAESNGVRRRIQLTAEHPAGTLTVARNGSVGAAFFQPEPYFATDDVHILYPKGWICSELQGVFICTLIKAEAFRYDYGRKWSLSAMGASILRLPSSAQGGVDWEWITMYMKSKAWSATLDDSESISALID